jgi:uncharacterized RDD family membrane protein YckC
MNRRANSEGLGPGVYYARDDYAGLLARFVIVAVDLGVIIVLGVMQFKVCEMLAQDEKVFALGFLGSWATTTVVYLVFIEASSLRTLGFNLTGMKIVNLRGERPSFWRMGFRQMLWVLGPFHPVVDLLWLSGDPNRQTLRDKLAGTYVVRVRAVPCGHGIVRLRHYFLLGLSVLFPEVQRMGATAPVTANPTSRHGPDR